MRDLVEVIVKALVNNPDQVEVTQKEEDRAILIEVHVAEVDMGKVIGKKGKIAQAIRTVVKSASTKETKKVIVDIV